MIVIRQESSSVSISIPSAALSSTVPPSSSSSTTTSSSPSSSTSDKPFFVAGSDLPAPSQSQAPGQAQANFRNAFAKEVLEWLFLAFALALLAAIVLKRLRTIGRRRRARGNACGMTTKAWIKEFFGFDRSRRDSVSSYSSDRERLPRTTGLPHTRTLSTSPYHLAEIPIAHLSDSGTEMGYVRHLNAISPPRILSNHARPGRTTRAADIDSGGRRMGVLGGGDEDYQYELGEETVLPAYDKYGGPPVYVDVLGVRAMIGEEIATPTTEEAPTAIEFSTFVSTAAFRAAATPDPSAPTTGDATTVIGTSGSPTTSPGTLTLGLPQQPLPTHAPPRYSQALDSDRHS